jgi:hypothetical protein
VDFAVNHVRMHVSSCARSGSLIVSLKFMIIGDKSSVSVFALAALGLGKTILLRKESEEFNLACDLICIVKKSDVRMKMSFGNNEVLKPVGLPAC